MDVNVNGGLGGWSNNNPLINSPTKEAEKVEKTEVEKKRVEEEVGGKELEVGVKKKFFYRNKKKAEEDISVTKNTVVGTLVKQGEEKDIDVKEDVAHVESIVRQADVKEEIATGKSVAAKAGKIERRAGKRARLVGLAMEPHRLAMGDLLRSRIKVVGGQEGWGVAAHCHATMACSLAVFQAVVAPHVNKVCPKKFDMTTPVILAQLACSRQIAAVFGAGRVQGSRRRRSANSPPRTWTATRMDLVYLPRERQLRAWWIMSE